MGAGGLVAAGGGGGGPAGGGGARQKETGFFSPPPPPPPSFSGSRTALVVWGWGGGGLVFFALGWLRPAFEFAPAGMAYWFALFVVEDFFYYVLHFADHHCRFFWATHVTHHSSQFFNLSTGFRPSVFQPMYRMLFFAPIAWLGFQPIDILVMYAATQIFGTFVHNEACGKLGPLEWIFVTPSHHRVHHASNPKYLDKNMGMALIVWDRLFGTFVEEDPNEPVRYGLTKPLDSRGPVNIVLHEWKSIWRDLRGNARNWRGSGSVTCSRGRVGGRRRGVRRLHRRPRLSPRTGYTHKEKILH